MIVEASKFVRVEVESQSQTHGHRCGLHYIDDLLSHAPLEVCSYWGCGQVFHLKIMRPA